LGLPSVQIDPVGGKLLDRALNGAWHYPVDNAGKRTRDKPKKDEASHPGDWVHVHQEAPGGPLALNTPDTGQQIGRHLGAGYQSVGISSLHPPLLSAITVKGFQPFPVEHLVTDRPMMPSRVCHLVAMATIVT
jgi:hypothetical protein